MRVWGLGFRVQGTTTNAKYSTNATYSALPATRRSTTLSSKVNLPHAVNFRASSCRATTNGMYAALPAWVLRVQGFGFVFATRGVSSYTQVFSVIYDSGLVPE